MTTRDIHELYQVYVDACEGRDCEALDYDEWLEQMLIINNSEIDLLCDELDMARHGAEINHCKYLGEVKKREALEASMMTVGYMLVHGDEAGARGLAVHFGVFN